MTLKYEITNICHPEKPNLFRIRALRVIPKFSVRAGDLGGYVEHEGNLSQEGNCWISSGACAYSNARIYDNALVYGNAHVCGNAHIHNYARVFHYARVQGDARLHSHAWLGGSVIISEAMEVSGNCYITTASQIYYVDGVTAYFDKRKTLHVSGTRKHKYHHETLARLKLS